MLGSTAVGLERFSQLTNLILGTTASMRSLEVTLLEMQIGFVNVSCENTRCAWLSQKTKGIQEWVRFPPQAQILES